MSGKSRKINGPKKQPEAKPTLEQILSFAKVKVYGLLELIDDDAIIKQQCKRATERNIKIRDDLKAENKKRKQDLVNKSVELNLEGLRIDTEFKRLTVETIELEKKLKTDDEARAEIAMAVVAAVFDNLHIQEENSGNAQMINTYIKKKFPEVLSVMGLTTDEKKSDIIVPDKKILMPGDPGYVMPE